MLDIKKTQIKLLEMENTITKIKNSLNEINKKIFLEERLLNMKI